MTSPADLRTIAAETAVAAGQCAREKWARLNNVSSKGFRDVVTEADFAAQAVITDAIQARFPRHGFLTEEEDSDLPGRGDVLWVIDPIDGTINFSRELPTFCVSVAAIRGGESQAAALAQPQVLAAAVFDPMRDELFSAALGEGGHVRNAHGDKRPLRVSAIDSLDQAFLTHDWSYSNDARQDILKTIDQLSHRVFNIRALGSAALALAWLAAGRVDLYFNFTLKPWDVAAAYLLVTEAGGKMTNRAGAPLRWHVGDMDCFTSNGRLHQPFLALTNAPSQ